LEFHGICACFGSLRNMPLGLLKTPVMVRSYFRDEKEFLSTQKSEIKRLVNADISALKEKEDELMDAVKELEKDQKRLEKEERAVIGRVNQLEREKEKIKTSREKVAAREKSIEAKKKEAENVIADAAKVKALRKELPSLRKEATHLKREVAKLEKMAAKRGAYRIAREVSHAASHADKIGAKAMRVERVARAAPVSTDKDELQSMIESGCLSPEDKHIETKKAKSGVSHTCG